MKIETEKALSTLALFVPCVTKPLSYSAIGLYFLRLAFSANAVLAAMLVILDVVSKW